MPRARTTWNPCCCIRGENADVLRFTGEFFERVTNADVRTDRGIMSALGGGPNIIVFGSDGRDRSRRAFLPAVCVDYYGMAPHPDAAFHNSASDPLTQNVKPLTAVAIS
ncbi:MAG TPA: hypothetical protein VLD18_01775, partial [Verrucomicrobiae bacterium]|nr:hypothetical protein [Verrucomicrobiae bacterium]